MVVVLLAVLVVVVVVVVMVAVELVVGCFRGVDPKPGCEGLIPPSLSLFLYQSFGKPACHFSGFSSLPCLSFSGSAESVIRTVEAPLRTNFEVFDNTPRSGVDDSSKYQQHKLFSESTKLEQDFACC